MVLSCTAAANRSHAALATPRAHNIIWFDLPGFSRGVNHSRLSPRRERSKPTRTPRADPIVLVMRPWLLGRARALLQSVRLHACGALRQTFHIGLAGYLGTSRSLWNRRSRSEGTDGQRFALWLRHRRSGKRLTPWLRRSFELRWGRTRMATRRLAGLPGRRGRAASRLRHRRVRHLRALRLLRGGSERPRHGPPPAVRLVRPRQPDCAAPQRAHLPAHALGPC
mmetsp:Transcript_38479/g.95241  ORF Transcript_38479/g.95241 Transcript_38479/m.95241 type:complete len:224 (-) Transcript_38479:245-916(-)